MAATNYTPIQLYRTTTAAAAPVAGTLSNGELASNYYTTDMALYAKSSTGYVIRLMNNPAGLKYPTADGTANQIIKTDGAGNLAFVTPAGGISLSANNTWTGTQTFNGTSAILATVLVNAAETMTISATAATGTINYDVTTQSVLYYTSNASANWTVNFRASSGTSLNTAMTTGQSLTVAFLVTQGATAYYNSAVQVDGSSVTPKWQGGTAPTAGNASSVDIYTYTIVKTGSAAFTIFASQTKFA
jgi:hypothetical protein